MFRQIIIASAAMMLLTPLPLWCGDEAVAGVPVIKEVTPRAAVPGAVVLATGEFLDRLHVSEVYLTRGTVDKKVQIMAQAGAELKFKVPTDLEEGRYGLTILTAANVPMLLDQPVWLQVKHHVDAVQPTAAVRQ